MWIVKTLGRRTRAGIDRVYSVNGAFVTQDLEEAADAAIEALKEEIAGNVLTSPYVILPMQTMMALAKREQRPQDTADYWNCTGAWSKPRPDMVLTASTL